MYAAVPEPPSTVGDQGATTSSYQGSAEVPTPMPPVLELDNCLPTWLCTQRTQQPSCPIWCSV